MGMFDSFMLTVKCPHCGNEEQLEFQTKLFDCTLTVWEEGEEFKTPEYCDEYLEINSGIIRNVVGSCNSIECDAFQKSKDGYESGFGRCVYCDVLIDNRIVKQAFNVRKEA